MFFYLLFRNLVLYFQYSFLFSIIQMEKLLYLTLILLALSSHTHAQNPTCPEGQLPFSSKCVPVAYIAGCSTYLPNGQCQTCEYGYSLTSNGICQQNSNQPRDCCNSYSSDGSCSKCISGLFWNYPYCYRNQITGCIRKEQNKCLVCGTGYFLHKGICLVQISFCQNYTINGECVSCLVGNRLVSGFCYPTLNIENCQVQNDYGCVQCSEGFYLSPSRSCSKFEPGCLKYWQGLCIACHPNFYFNQNKKCIIDGCQLYSFDSCLQCKQGFTSENGRCTFNGCVKLVKNTCVQCKEGLRLSAQGCVQPINYQCITCRSGFTFINGACIKVIFGCNQYDNSLCTTCRNPFQLTINGRCQINGCQTYNETGCSLCTSPFVLNNNICAINYCLQYTNEGCSTCQEGYLLINKRCFLKDNNCLQYSTTGSAPICTKCASSFFLFQGTCKQAARGCNYDLQGKCFCKSPFEVSPQNTCQIRGCNKYNWQVCLSCIQPFVLNSKTQLCQIPSCYKYSWSGCQTCQNGCISINGACVIADINCLSFNNKGNCIACKQSFILDGGRCVKNVPNCQAFTYDRISCAKCKNGFELFDGTCYAQIDNCCELKIEAGIASCKTCNLGYYLSRGQCAIQDPNCATYVLANGGSQVCNKCREGFYLSTNGNCFAQKAGCLYRGSECVGCITPFIYDSNNKKCQILGCKSYSSTGCLQCSAPFTLNGQTCTIINCVGYNKDGCASCISGFALTQSGLCAHIDPYCIKYQGSSCLQCKEGFSLNNGSCIFSDINCQSYTNGFCQSCAKGYYLNVNKKCEVSQNGCIYEAGVCKFCSSPFIYSSNTKNCVINACIQANPLGCIKCKSPFVLATDQTCQLKNCLRSDNNGCIQCGPQYHIKDGECIIDNINCLSYKNGLCELCAKDFILSSDGECTPGSEAACLTYSTYDKTKCLVCGDKFFLNSYFQCEKKDGYCEEYINGVCSKCADRYFLYKSICFPYTKGCVAYSGKDCNKCKVNYEMRNGECFFWKRPNFKLQDGDDHYDFDITPIDVRQSKYYINNLSPASQIGKFFFSSYFDESYQDCSLSNFEGEPSKGWKAKTTDQNQFIGIQIKESPVTFYALQIQAVEGNYITQFYLEYSVDGNNFITVQNAFKVPSAVGKNMTTIYFTGIYASAIRIRISRFKGWVAARINFFYYDLIRFKKISNLKSLTYLQNAINSTFVDRVDNQIYINKFYFFNPNAGCSVQELCFTGLQLCQNKQITSLTLSFEDPSNYVTQFYLTYSVDGRSYNCYKNCQVFNINDVSNSSYSLNLESLVARGVRIYPKSYKGNTNFSPTFFYN